MTKPAAHQRQSKTDKSSYPGIYRTKNGLVRICTGSAKMVGAEPPIRRQTSKGKSPQQRKLEMRERMALYKRWAEIVQESIDFQSLSLSRSADDIFHLCNYLLQADFSSPGQLEVTLYIMRGMPVSPKTGHEELRRQRKIWLIPSFIKEKDCKGNETVAGIRIHHDVQASFSVDAKHAFMTIKIETDAVPPLAELDRLFTRKEKKK